MAYVRKRSEGSSVFLYSIGWLYGCLSVCDFYIPSLGCDARKKTWIEVFFAKNFLYQIFKFLSACWDTDFCCFLPDFWC